ncbi:hypothetical protein EJ05DRAFT_479684 [Pseudovirgaria hyperparasitica]|uniref:Uncharacterized protein n=1 Tax=Pseudovirgaria hyperparasitica TaxID=470096 RepID=A0A6A6VWG7_9PEZI|nr:uncharacterized protein EJ05DRAFT_479684 [Pseudovirgaria hyperparasitica]KAF2754136.1 hypothetical protein EJ05DRAFT_479684 [Pseudovirgaria hyperparasitica]
MADWVSRQLAGVTAGISNFTGGVVNAVGSGVSGAGKGVSNSVAGTTRGWGNSVRSYGNSIKDATGASGPRAPTADNPLGMARNKASVKASGQVQKGRIQTPSGGTARDPLGLQGK